MNPANDTRVPAPASPETGTGFALYPQSQHVLLAGLILGLAGDYLLWEGLAGPGLAAWLALLAGASLWLARAGGPARTRTLATWSATALGAALMLVWRDLNVLFPALWLVIIASATLTSLETGGLTLRSARLGDHLLALLKLPLHIASLAPRLLGQIELRSFTQHPRLPGLLRGVLLALPLLVVFFGLFSAADAAFNRYALALSGIFSPSLPRHLLMPLVFGWIAASLLALACRKPHAAEPRTPIPLNLGTVEATVILGSVSALFCLFVLLQLGYLFGGSATIEATSGLTLAAYARRGFFELVLVAGLTLALLLALGASNCERRVLRHFGTVLIVCVLIILASAVQRLFLYTDAFGLTLARFNALAVILWQAFNLLSFAMTVLRGRIHGFASGLAISGIASLLLLGLANPAALVARVNLERARDANRSLDIQYLLQLGADAVPVVLERFATLPAREQCEVAREVLSAFPVAMDGSPLSNTNWHKWNVGRMTAHTAVAERSEQLYLAAAVPRAPGPLALFPGIRPC